MAKSKEANMRSYLQETLLNNEKIIFKTNPHWIIFAPSAFWFLFGIFLIEFLPQTPGQYMPFLGDLLIHNALIYFVFIVCLSSLMSAYVTYRTSEYGITNRRVLMKTGLIRRYSLEIFLNRIESINVRQPLMGRIIGYGGVYVIGTGGTTDFFNYIPNPLGFRRKVQYQINLIMDQN